MRLSVMFAASLTLLNPCAAAELPEYRLKAAYLYNFAQFTSWPADVGKTLRLCTYGSDPFGVELDGLEDKPVGDRTLRLQRQVRLEDVAVCQVLYVSRGAMAALPAVQREIAGRPVLLVTDSPGAARRGAMLNMTVAQNRVTFEANRRAAGDAALDLSFRLLRLATEVIQ